MMEASMWQHVAALVAALLALGWLVRRAVKGRGSKATGPCASCPAGTAASRRPAVSLAPRETPPAPR